MILMKYAFENRSSNLKAIVRKTRDNVNGSYSEFSRWISDRNEVLNTEFKQTDKAVMPMVYDADKEFIYVICAYQLNKKTNEEAKAIIASHLNGALCIKEEEITISDFSNQVYKIAALGYLHVSATTLLNKLDLDVDARSSYMSPPIFKYEEEIFSDPYPDKKEALKKAEEIMASDSMKEELKRIYSSKNLKKFYGHPVHYYITAGDWGAAQDMIRLLIPALLKNKRLVSQRAGFVQALTPRCYQEQQFENLFSAAIGSTLVIDLSGNVSYGNYATGYQRNAEIMGRKLAELGNDALFIFVEISDSIVYRDENLAMILGSGDIVKIDEGYGDYERANNYLKDLIKRSEFSDYGEGAEKYLPDKVSFTVSDVYDAYNKWYGSGLKNHIYKAYKTLDSVKITVKKKEGDPYKMLKEMIGLEDIKKVIDQIIVHEKIQLKRKEVGLDTATSCRHMLFYGNPGTAKTTVARLLSQILKEEGVLENGHLVEVGRQDLVARYVGWTAKTVEEKFREARGGVLFIDEAYSLIDRADLFGTEAINTIVQLMENYRDEVIVIFAGYPDKMRKFVEQNEGLASRIAFQLDFPDYNGEELLGIMDIMLKEREYTMDEEARTKCLKLFDKAATVKDFGNGRFVRNMLERVELRQSERVARDYENLDIDSAELGLIKAEDIMEDYNFLTANKNDKRIGYAS